MIKIEMDLLVTKEDLKGKGHGISHADNGLYFIFDEKKQLLYIGWASFIRDRLRQHMQGKSSNTAHFAHEMHRAAILFGKRLPSLIDEVERKTGEEVADIEYWLIQKLEPKYNKQRGTSKRKN